MVFSESDKNTPLVCPGSSTRGGVLKWNSPDTGHGRASLANQKNGDSTERKTEQAGTNPETDRKTGTNRKRKQRPDGCESKRSGIIINLLGAAVSVGDCSFGW